MYKLPLCDWLSYSDRDHHPLFPINSSYVTTHWYSESDKTNEENHLKNRKEKFLTNSALIRLQDFKQAQIINWQDKDLDISPGWNDDGSFDFGTSAISKGIEIFPFVHIWRHPVTQSLQLRIRPDFEAYHALESRDKCEDKLFHPLDRTAVIQMEVLEFDFTESSPGIRVHQSYLRDYLAARNMALVISVVCNRFANATDHEIQSVKQVEDYQIEPSTWITTEVRDWNPQAVACGIYRTRSILWRTVVIEPFESPNINGTAWYTPNRLKKDLPLPSGFKVDSAGKIGTLQDANRLDYLDFRPAVLQKFLTNEGYGVRFHMKHWGVAWDPSGNTIDVGMNDEGVLNAFVHDLLKQRPEEQAHWASFSIPKTGHICYEMYQTRMKCDPPKSDSVPVILGTARESLNKSFMEKFGFNLFDSHKPNERQWQNLSVGPVTEDAFELFRLVKVIYKWLIETMNIKSLNKAIDNSDLVDPKWRQIKLIKVLLEKEQVKQDDISEICDSMKLLNKLRIEDAHLLSSSDNKLAELIAGDEKYPTFRDKWLSLVDKTIAAFSKFTNILS